MNTESSTDNPHANPDEFDFARHRSEAMERYRGLRGLYDGYANCIRSILLAAIPTSYPIHSVEARAKEVESFGDKASKALGSDPQRPRYADPLSQITDLAGVRVITYFPKTLEGVEKIIKSQFTVTEITDKSVELFESERFGYQSIHYTVRLKDSRIELPEYERFKGLVAEIQLRTILQHAWAEMEHDIQYKSFSSIPATIRRRFMSLAGMLEIADREFQAIQDADERLRSEMQDTLAEDLKDVVDLRVYVAQLESEIRELKDSKAPSTYLPGSARSLLDKGYYEEAIRAYSRVIDLHPSVHTNFFGRARARFLAGDTPGALEDLKKAEELYPYDPTVERLREQILEGAPLTSPSSLGGYKAAALGNEELSRGHGKDALAHYQYATELGVNFISSVFNRAMAHCLSDEFDEALSLLDSFQATEGSFMEVNVLALKAVCAVRSGESFDQLILDLQRLDQLSNFDYDRSPLRFLEAGLKEIREYESSKRVFQILRKETM